MAPSTVTPEAFTRAVWGLRAEQRRPEITLGELAAPPRPARSVRAGGVDARPDTAGRCGLRRAPRLGVTAPSTVVDARLLADGLGLRLVGLCPRGVALGGQVRGVPEHPDALLDCVLLLP